MMIDKNKTTGEGAKIFVGKLSDLTEKILKAYYTVYNTLGYGFSESVYENALAVELTNMGLKVERQKAIQVYYGYQMVGHYIADLLVNDLVVLELKAVRKLLDEHDAQLLNYLKATKHEVGLLLNFGSKPEYRRKVFDNYRKGSLSWTKKG
jgi:GxxExxY protein